MSDASWSARVAALNEVQMAYLQPRLAEIGLNLNTFQLLAAIHAAGDEASQAEVARRLGVSAATLSESVQTHITKGWIVQTPSPTDRRVRLLTLTTQASERLRKVMRYLSDFEQRVASGIKPKELQTCLKVLDQLTARGEFLISGEN